MSSLPAEFSDVTVHTKANVYFDGKVISYTVRFADGTRKTLGVIHPGTFHFKTGVAERMEIVAGDCLVTLDDGTATQEYVASQQFEVPANSGFTIEVHKGLCQYVCSFL
jgi:uncharacterized protein YaiE (UPF0345 family)